MPNNHKFQKILDLTCQECLSVYQLLEVSEPGLRQSKCDNQCLTYWKQLLHAHYQEQIILFLAQTEAQKDKNHD